MTSTSVFAYVTGSFGRLRGPVKRVHSSTWDLKSGRPSSRLLSTREPSTRTKTKASFCCVCIFSRCSILQAISVCVKQVLLSILSAHCCLHDLTSLESPRPFQIWISCGVCAAAEDLKSLLSQLLSCSSMIFLEHCNSCKLSHTIWVCVPLISSNKMSGYSSLSCNKLSPS